MLVLIKGICTKTLSNVIYTIQMSVQKGCQAYLTNVVDLSKMTLKIEKTNVLQEFVDVYLEELLGLPLYRKVQFTIDLVPGTPAISKTLYRTAFAKLKEQLLELLD